MNKKIILLLSFIGLQSIHAATGDERVEEFFNDANGMKWRRLIVKIDKENYLPYICLLEALQADYDPRKTMSPRVCGALYNGKQFINPVIRQALYEKRKVECSIGDFFKRVLQQIGSEECNFTFNIAMFNAEEEKFAKIKKEKGEWIAKLQRAQDNSSNHSLFCK